MKATGKTCGGNDGCGKPKRQGFPQPWKSLRDSHIPTARLLLYIFPKPIPKGVFLTACTFSLQAHSSIRKDYGLMIRATGSFQQSAFSDQRSASLWLLAVILSGGGPLLAAGVEEPLYWHDSSNRAVNYPITTIHDPPLFPFGTAYYPVDNSPSPSLIFRIIGLRTFSL